MRVRCLDCREWATRFGRCDQHHKASEAARSRQSHSKRREAIARGDRAAAIMRAALRSAGMGTCASCGMTFLPSAMDVDHVVPLSRGGEDVASNVQALCRPCHRAKTRIDLRWTTTPF